jgi:hypothetical protein
MSSTLRLRPLAAAVLCLAVIATRAHGGCCQLSGSCFDVADLSSCAASGGTFFPDATCNATTGACEANPAEILALVDRAIDLELLAQDRLRAGDFSTGSEYPKESLDLILDVRRTIPAIRTACGELDRVVQDDLRVDLRVVERLDRRANRVALSLARQEDSPCPAPPDERDALADQAIEDVAQAVRGKESMQRLLRLALSDCDTPPSPRPGGR